MPRDKRNGFRTAALLQAVCVGVSLAPSGCQQDPSITELDDAAHDGDRDAGDWDAGVYEDARAKDAAVGMDLGKQDAIFSDGDGSASDGSTGDDAGDLDAGASDAATLGCTSCHGSSENAAPPVDRYGGTASSLTSVGAHQAHVVGGSGWHRDGLCTDCHLVPLTTDDPGHVDSAPAEVVFDLIAESDGASPEWNGVTCAGTYCHGATMSGAGLTEPEWTTTSPLQAYCGSCHGVPPPAPHPEVLDWNCSGCHPNAAPALSWLDPQLHINGIVDLSLSCSSCHGDDTSPAPPTDLDGSSETTSTGVGAHRSHLGSSIWHAEIQCDDCHIVPESISDAGHVDDARPADVTFGSLATTDDADAAWDGTSCSGVYCHGATLGGGADTSPTWTIVDGTQAACGDCHSLPPPAPHPASSNCSTCHSNLVATDDAFIDPSLHINGSVEGTFACGDCHDLPPPTGSHVVHANLAEPVYGGLDTAMSLGLADGYAFGCGHCHPLDSAWHLSGGPADVELYDPAAPAGSLKALSPDATYTPGEVTYTDDFAVPYTLGTCGNVYCHSGPTYATPDGVPAPGVDFAFTGYPIVYPSFALTRSREFAAPVWGSTPPSCSGCHGYPIQTSEPTVQAMAGQTHAWIDPDGYGNGHAFAHGFDPLFCRTCHFATVTAANGFTRDSMDVTTFEPVPIVGFDSHVNGQPDVEFDTTNPVVFVSTMDLTTAAYDASSRTCTNVACHLLQTSVVSGTPYRYWNGLECNSCHQY